MFFAATDALHILPGQLSFEEVDEHEADGFQVVAPGKFFAEMRVDAGISCCAGQRLVIPVVYVLLCHGAKHSLWKTHVNNVTYAWVWPDSHEEVIWLDVPMNKTVVVHKFEPVQELCSKHQSRLQAESVSAEMEKVSKTRPHQLHAHKEVFFILAITIHFRESVHPAIGRIVEQ